MSPLHRSLIAALLLASTLVACGSDDPATVAPTTTAAPASTTTALSVDLAALGESEVVSYLQEALASAGFYEGPIDGRYGAGTAAAIEAFQRAHDLPPHGRIDAATLLALADESPEAEHLMVSALQTELTELGYFAGIIDGEFGADTIGALEALQEEYGLDVTGDFDEPTFAALVQAYLELVAEPAEEQAPSTTTAPTTAPTTTVPAPSTTPPHADGLQRGDQGPAVHDLQQRLAELGYRPGAVDGNYGAATESAVMAFQKHEGLGRDGIAGVDVLARLAAPIGAGPVGGGAPRIEIDLDRQIAFVVDAGGRVAIVSISSGSGLPYTPPGGGTAVAYTPTGTFSVLRRIDGLEQAPLGTLYRPLYFYDGWAVHGSTNVPGYPASHGCVRTSYADQDFIWSVIPNGAAVVIHGATAGSSTDAEPGF